MSGHCSWSSLKRYTISAKLRTNICRLELALLVTGRRNQSMEESKVPEPDSQGLSTD